jgi:flagellar basal-body rod protein FlgG
MIGIGAAGLRGQQLALETLGHNVANVNTPGFKADKVDFAEAFQASLAGTTTVNGAPANAPSVGPGSGVMISGMSNNFQQGILVPSDSPWDLAIDGEGFFQVQMPNGTTAYTRAGAFRLDGEGSLVDPQGNKVITMNGANFAGAENISVAANGTITGTVGGTEQQLDTIQLVKFTQPQGLNKIGGNLFLESANSGAPIVGDAQTDDFGSIRSMMLEQSNVDIASTMTDLIQAQRAYEMNSKVVQAGDEMWSIANSLRR